MSPAKPRAKGQEAHESGQDAEDHGREGTEQAPRKPPLQRIGSTAAPSGAPAPGGATRAGGPPPAGSAPARPGGPPPRPTGQQSAASRPTAHGAATRAIPAPPGTAPGPVPGTAPGTAPAPRPGQGHPNDAGDGPGIAPIDPQEADAERSAEDPADAEELPDAPGGSDYEPLTADLASTGISGLDAQYGGGLPQGSLYLVVSDPTTATSIFAAQYAAAGLDASESVYYFTFERPASEVRESIDRFVDGPIDDTKLHIIDGYALQFHHLPEQLRRRLGMKMGPDPLATLTDLLLNPDLSPSVRIIVESATELADHYDRDRVFETLRLMRAAMRRVNGTAVISLVKPLHEPREVAQAKHIADGVVEFHVERKGFGIYPYIAVTKMRGVTGSARLLLFKETDSGLWLESTKRVY